MKVCTVCKISKPVTHFWKDRGQKSGLRPDCVPCAKIKSAAQRIKHAIKIKENSRKKYHANPLPDREKHLKRKYGIDQKIYEYMFKLQKGQCAICGKTQGRAFDVDHCHKSGVVRGLLCTSCNRMLGHSGDNPANLTKGALYLRKSRRSSSKRT